MKLSNAWPGKRKDIISRISDWIRHKKTNKAYNFNLLDNSLKIPTFYLIPNIIKSSFTITKTHVINEVDQM